MAKKILLAEDSVTMRTIFQMAFAAEDFTVTAVPRAEAAIEQARTLRPDIVIADLSMDGKNGYDVCSAVKSDPSLARIPVLLLHGSAGQFDSQRAQAVKADGDLGKPFETQRLIETVQELTARPVVAPRAPMGPVKPLAAPFTAKDATTDVDIEFEADAFGAGPVTESPTAKQALAGVPPAAKQQAGAAPPPVKQEPASAPPGRFAAPSAVAASGTMARRTGGTGLEAPAVAAPSPARPSSGPPAVAGLGIAPPVPAARPQVPSAPPGPGLMIPAVPVLRPPRSPVLEAIGDQDADLPADFEDVPTNLVQPSMATEVEITIEAEPPSADEAMEGSGAFPSFDEPSTLVGSAAPALEVTRRDPVFERMSPRKEPSRPAMPALVVESKAPPRPATTLIGVGESGSDLSRLPPPPPGLGLPLKAMQPTVDDQVEARTTVSGGGFPIGKGFPGADPAPGSEDRRLSAPPGSMLDPATYDAIVKLSREVIEKVVWEVVPELAERIIRDELERIVEKRRSSPKP